VNPDPDPDFLLKLEHDPDKFSNPFVGFDFRGPSSLNQPRNKALGPRNTVVHFPLYFPGQDLGHRMCTLMGSKTECKSTSSSKKGSR
jgi:hypothetical protein